MEDKIIKTDNGVKIKILTNDLCCIYADENSSNYFIKKEYLEEALRKDWN